VRVHKRAKQLFDGFDDRDFADGIRVLGNAVALLDDSALSMPSADPALSVIALSFDSALRL
jgi:hypothetical protein